MNHKLTDEQISQLCMFMRVTEFLKTNQHVFEENEAFKQSFEAIQNSVKQIMEALTQEEIDEILEEHQQQLGQLAKTPHPKTAKQKKGKG